MTTGEISERARRVHREAIVIDMLEVLFPLRDRDIGYFKVAADAGVTAINGTIPDVNVDLPAAIARTAKFYKFVESAGNVKVVSTVDDIESAKRQGKLAIILGMQDTIPFETNLDLVRIFHRLSFKVMQLTFDTQNYFGAGNTEPVDSGLTSRGKEAVKELNRLGILIGVSHCGNKTAIDAAQASKNPIAITHATPSALVDIPRGKSDAAMKAVAERGGVIGQEIVTTFCEKSDRAGARATLRDFLDLIDYTVNLVGVDHVGLGLALLPLWTKEEWEGPAHRIPSERRTFPHKMKCFEEKYVEGFKGISDIIRITEGLVTHGYSDGDIKKILGGNWLRLLKEVCK